MKMAPPRPQRIVRRQTFSARMQALLNPMDLYLWVSEEIQTFDWDSQTFGTRFGVAANFLFLLLQANSGAPTNVDDVFGDVSGASWGSFLIKPLVWILAFVSLGNAWYTMTRCRHYRLFEANVEQTGPSTPSAHRVRVDSSPVSSSPIRMLQDALGSESAEARAHPDRTRDVWELALWDPFPATLRIFCLFSPGHVLVHMLFLPLPMQDPSPSITVFKCLALQVILSGQLLLLQTRFSQQSKDAAIIQKEVLHEYDTKYVHPRLHPTVREASTQITIGTNGVEQESVDVGTPTTLIRRGFKTNPNPNYAKHFDPDNVSQPQARNVMSPSIFNPVSKPRTENFFSSRMNRQPTPSQSLASPPSGFMRDTASTSTSTDIGGSLGVFSHGNSPLKKASSLGDFKGPGGGAFSPRNSREMAALEQMDIADRMVRQSSPLKENRRATTHFGANQPSSSSQAQAPAPFVNHRANRWNQERFPSRYS